MKTILFSILILCSVNAFSFNWKKVGENISGDSYYVDVDNIKKLNGLVYYWVLGDYLEPFDSETNSTISKYKVDFGEEIGIKARGAQCECAPSRLEEKRPGSRSMRNA